VTDTRELVGLTIGGRSWRSWTTIEIKRSLDAVTTFAFTAPFEPERSEFRNTFKPFSFAEVEITTNDEPLCKGTMLGVEPALTEESRSVSVTGYGLPGVLGDCCMPANALPIGYRGLDLATISQIIADQFGLTLVVEGAGSESVPFDLVKMEATETPFSFLVKLAQQRTMLVSDTPAGALRLWTPPTGGSPVATFRQWAQPAVSIASSFKPQEWFSEITGMKNANGGRGGGMYTEKNPAAPSTLFRPSSFAVDDADKGDVASATVAKVGRMIGNALTVSVEVPTWRDEDGELWTPNAVVKVEAPGCMIYSETEFIIREVTLKQTAEATTASLELSLPGAFTGEIPSVMPWD
jgi:prophage tail gpP-like protein